VLDSWEKKTPDHRSGCHIAQGGNKALVVAGYYWPWLSKKAPNAADIVIGDYKRQ